MIEKKYLSFSEIAKRWNLPENDVHYLIQQEKLTPAIIWNGMVSKVKLIDISPFDDGSEYYEEQEKDIDGNFIYSPTNNTSPLFLVKPTIKGAYKYEFEYASFKLKSRNNDYFYKLAKVDYGNFLKFDDFFIQINAFFIIENVKENEENFINAELEKAKSTITREHVSDNLAFLNQASERFWKLAVKNDPSTHPKNSDVEKWLIERGFTQTLAKKAASIIRPDWASKGRPKEY